MFKAGDRIVIKNTVHKGTIVRASCGGNAGVWSVKLDGHIGNYYYSHHSLQKINSPKIKRHLSYWK